MDEARYNIDKAVNLYNTSVNFTERLGLNNRTGRSWFETLKEVIEMLSKTNG